MSPLSQATNWHWEAGVRVSWPTGATSLDLNVGLGFSFNSGPGPAASLKVNDLRANFHLNVYARMGYEAECRKIQELYLDGRKAEAMAAVPAKLVEDTALVGPVAKIRDDLERWKNSIVTTLLIGGDPTTLRTMAELCL